MLRGMDAATGSNERSESPTDLLSQLQDREAADLANEVAKTYEKIEQVYNASLGAETTAVLAASANRRT
jgi:hypothetical protein